MKLTKRNSCVIFAMVFFAILGSFFASTSSEAYAVETSKMTIGYTERTLETFTLQQATSVSGATTGVSLGSGIVGTKKFTVNQQEVRNSALKAVIKWREDAYKDSRIKFGDNQTIPEYLAANNITKEQYLNPSWSNALERIAVQRAMEAGDSTLGHTRPNGDSCFTASYGGVTSSAEVLAYKTGTYSYTGENAVDQWATEKAEYIKECSGQTYGETGHYVAIIDPTKKSYGFGIVSGYDFDYCAAGEAGTQSFSGNDAASTNWKGDYYLDMAISNELVAAHDVNVNIYTGVFRLNVGNSFSFAGTLGYRNNTFAIKDNWYSSNSSVLQVQTSGASKALKAGTARVYILGQNNAQIYIDVTVPVNMEMSRLYNPNSGEHFYTGDAGEREYCVLVGWKYEGVGWNAPAKSNTPVYRLYNPNGGDHHYTMSKAEHDWLVTLGWRSENVGWYSDDSKAVALFRQYNPNAKSGSHNFTTSKSENDWLVGLGWRAEGIGWYGVK